MSHHCSVGHHRQAQKNPDKNSQDHNYISSGNFISTIQPYAITLNNYYYLMVTDLWYSVLLIFLNLFCSQLSKIDNQNECMPNFVSSYIISNLIRIL